MRSGSGVTPGDGVTLPPPPEHFDEAPGTKAQFPLVLQRSEPPQHSPVLRGLS